MTTQTTAPRDRPERPARAGGYWRALPHADFLDGFNTAASAAGWDVSEPHVSLTSNRREVYALVRVRHKDVSESHNALAALRNSTDRRCSPRLYVCSESPRGGAVPAARLHLTPRLTTKTDMDSAWARVVSQMKSEVMGLGNLVTALERRPLTRDDYNHLLLEAAREGFIPWGRLRRADDLYHEEKRKTRYGLYLAFCEAERESSDFSRAERCYRFLRTLL